MGLPSLDIIADEVRRERDRQLSHFDSVDTKAGIVLGFAGAIASLASRESSVLSLVGAIGASAAALLALWAFFPRRYPVLDLLPLRDLYIRAQEEFAKLHLVDTQILMAQRAAELIRRKAFRLKCALVSLGLAIPMTAVGALLG